MKLSAIIEREAEAIVRDLLKRDKKSYSMEELWESLDEYPSVMTRFNRVLGIIDRGKDKVLSFPSNLKSFVHRGRYGWATPDTWSMDYALAKQLDGVFREFVRVSSDIIDYEQDDTDKIALEIADGFAAWVAYEDREWGGDFDPKEDFDTYHKKRNEEYERAAAMVQRSCKLMGENWSRFWW